MTIWTSFFTEYAEWLVGISLFTIIIILILVPVLVLRIPADYFSHRHRHRLSDNSHHPVINFLASTIKNVFGLVLVCAGILMLFLPGQGLITLLVGLMIMNYPGKYTLERWLIRRLHILPAMNWLRIRRGCQQLEIPAEPEA